MKQFFRLFGLGLGLALILTSLVIFYWVKTEPSISRCDGMICGIPQALIAVGLFFGILFILPFTLNVFLKK